MMTRQTARDDLDQVKTPLAVHELPMVRDMAVERRGDALPLARGDQLALAPAARLDLAGDQQATAPGQDVDLAAWPAHPARQDAETLAEQQQRRQGFGPAAVTFGFAPAGIGKAAHALGQHVHQPDHRDDRRAGACDRHRQANHDAAPGRRLRARRPTAEHARKDHRKHDRAAQRQGRRPDVHGVRCSRLLISARFAKDDNRGANATETAVMIDRAGNRIPAAAAWFAPVLVLGLLLTGCKSREPAFEPAPQPEVVEAPAAPVEPAFTQAPGIEGAPLSGTAAADYGQASPLTRRIALVLPLTGQYGGIGADLLDAATLALFDIGGQRMELVVADTQGTPEGAAAAVRQVLAGQPDLIVGPLFAQEVSAAAPVAEQAGIPMIALSSDLTVAEPGVYLLGIAPEQQIDRVIAHAAQQGFLRFAVLAPQNAFGRRMAGAMEQAVARSGGQVVQRAFYNPDGLGIEETVRELTRYKARQADLEAQIAELRLRGDEVSLAAIARLEEMEQAGTVSFDALLIPESGSLLRELSAWLGYYDVNPTQVRLMGLANWNDPSLLREPLLRGAWFAMTPRDRTAWFNGRFEAAYGSTPPPVAALAYDAMALAAGLSKAGDNGDFSEAAVTDWRGFSGIEGIFRFNGDGTPERGLVVMEIQPGGVIVAAPAPTSFRPAAVSMLVP